MEKYQVIIDNTESQIKTKPSSVEESEAKEAIIAHFKNVFNIRKEDLIVVREGTWATNIEGIKDF